MRECIARLIKCGMPRDIAVCICKLYAIKDDWHGMQKYVEAIEEETKYREEEEW